MYQSQFNQHGMSADALAAWARFEELTGRGWGINSAYRDPAHNERVGGAKRSQHTHGNAFDIDVSGLPTSERQNLIRLARQAGFGGVGVYDNALHFDVAGQRHWGPSYGRESTPSWALDALGTEVHYHGDGHDHSGDNVPTSNVLARLPQQSDPRMNALAMMQLAPRPQVNMLDPSMFMIGGRNGA